MQDHETAIPGVSPQDTGGQKINKGSGGAWSDAGRVLKIYEGEDTG